jgi:hypothetical protein
MPAEIRAQQWNGQRDCGDDAHGYEDIDPETFEKRWERVD